MKPTPIKVWITQYWSTKGIYEAEAVVCSNISDDMISVDRVGAMNGHDLYHKPGWHTSYEAAVAYASAARDRKVKSMEKKIAELKAMVF